MKKLIAIGLAGMMCLSTMGCATPFFDNPTDSLNTVEAGFATTLALYNSICIANPAISVCTTADMAEASSLEQTITSAINAAQVLVALESSTASGSAPTTAQVSAAIQNVTLAVTSFSNFVNNLQVKKAKMEARMKT